MENQPKTLKTYKNRHGTMKNQSGAIKTNLELYRVVKGGSGGYRRLTGGSDDFSLQTDRQTLHHNIYIIIIINILSGNFHQCHISGGIGKRRRRTEDAEDWSRSRKEQWMIGVG